MVQEPEQNGKERRRVQPQGGAYEWSDADIERLADLTPAKIADAKADAARLPELDALLRAKVTRRGE